MATGLVHGANIGDLGAGLGIGLETMTVQIPAVLLIGGITAALIGWVPRFAAVGWAVLGLSVLLGQLGTLLSLPQPVMDLSPFSHIPALPAAPMHWTPLVVLLLLAVVATALGLRGLLAPRCRLTACGAQRGGSTTRCRSLVRSPAGSAAASWAAKSLDTARRSDSGSSPAAPAA